MGRRIYNGRMKLGFIAMEKGMNRLIKDDPEVRAFSEKFVDGYRVRVCVCSSQHVTVVEKYKDQFYGFKASKLPSKVDIDIVFKSYKWIPEIILGKYGLMESYNNHQVVLKGNIAESIYIVHILEKLLTYSMSRKKYIKLNHREPERVMFRAAMAFHIIFDRRRTK